MDKGGQVEKKARNAHLTKERQYKKSQAHLEDFHHHFLIVGHIYGLKYFTVLPSTQFTHQLVVVLIAEKEQKHLAEIKQELTFRHTEHDHTQISPFLRLVLKQLVN